MGVIIVSKEKANRSSLEENGNLTRVFFFYIMLQEHTS